ncbi:MAG: AzlC family ABC transporter permease [Lachnospiraceae bacterium]|nr:AzlC family ABC transporter permease [Lachnospiraceae bacterium]
MRRKALRAALPLTIPVLMGYLFLGIAFGVLLSRIGYHVGWAFLMSVFIYAGAMQFVVIELLASPFGLFNALLLTLTVNARHLFYGFSLLEKFSISGKLKPYMIFSLTDETYSLLCVAESPQGVNRKWFRFFIAALNHLYWVLGSLLGNVAGTLLDFDYTGIEFAMTALFIVIFIEQWESTKKHLPALLGLGLSLLCLLLFGSENFVIFSMIAIFFSLAILYRRNSRVEREAEP